MRDEGVSCVLCVVCWMLFVDAEVFKEVQFDLKSILRRWNGRAVIAYFRPRL